MPQQTFALVTSPITTSNDVKVALYKKSSPNAEYDSQQQTGSLGTTTWTFTGLPRVPFEFQILEVAIGGSTVIQTLSSRVTFVPDTDEFVTEWIIADTTVGLTSASTSFTFDGSAGTADWRGYTIEIERIGQGTMEASVDYTWNSTTGVFQLLNSGDEFQPAERFFVTIKRLASNPAIEENGIFTSTKIVTADETLLASDAGKKIIIKGGSDYIEVTLPTLTSVVENRPFYIESATGFHSCLKIISQDANAVEYPTTGRSDLYLKPAETITIFKSIDTSVESWRVHDDNSQMKRVGEEFTSYKEVDDIINAIEMDDSDYDADKEARLYNDVVLNLPSSAICNYADRATGTNYLKFTLKDPVTNKFKVPDARGLYARNASASLDPATYQANQNLAHSHRVNTTGNQSGVDPGRGLQRSSTNGDGYGVNGTGVGTVPYIESVGGSEARPETYVTRRFILT